MSNEVMEMKTTVLEFNNEELNRCTKEILNIGINIKKSYYKIAKILAKIESDELYKDDGFKSAIEYAQNTFGFKKTMAYSLIKIGKDFVNDNYESILPHSDMDFTFAQIERLLPLKDKDKIIKMVEDEEIKPDMTCEEIRNIVKKKSDKNIINSTAEEIENSVQTENTENSVQTENTENSVQTENTENSVQTENTENSVQTEKVESIMNRGNLIDSILNNLTSLLNICDKEEIDLLVKIYQNIESMKK